MSGEEIFRCEHGSRLFGTATPFSNRDERSITLPSRRDALLGRTMGTRSLREGRERKARPGDADEDPSP